MDTIIKLEEIEGEIGLVIDYEPGSVEVKYLFQGALRIIESLETIDRALLSSINTSLEPVSILNDVQHSSLKILLARALKKIPDHAIEDLDWKKWVGILLVTGKHKLISCLDDSDAVEQVLVELKPLYDQLPNSTAGHIPPDLKTVKKALNDFKQARASVGNTPVKVQTEFGDISIPILDAEYTVELIEPNKAYQNVGRKYFKVKTPDFLGKSMWEVLMDGKAESVKISHDDWLSSFHKRAFDIKPHDSLDADYVQDIIYSEDGEVMSKTTVLTYIHDVVPPAKNSELKMD